MPELGGVSGVSTAMKNIAVLFVTLMQIFNRPLLIQATSNSSEFTRTLNELTTDYDTRLRPAFGDKPLDVGITMHIDSLGPISEVDMSFRVDFAFRQYWKDERLTFNETWENITLSHEFLQKIWLPDTYFPDSLKAVKHNVMVPNILLRLSPDGHILYSARVTVVGMCPMDLTFFPMDEQICSLMIECYGYTTRDLVLSWEKSYGSPVEVSANINIAQFTIGPTILKEYSLAFSTGNFSHLEVQFALRRDILFFVIQCYIPATLIVILSWVSFFVNRNAVPARASLAITTVLTMITLIGTSNSSLPKVSDVKALDVYLGMCFLYVFGALVEFSAICYFNKPRYLPQPPPPPLPIVNPLEALDRDSPVDMIVMTDLGNHMHRKPFLRKHTNGETPTSSCNSPLMPRPLEQGAGGRTKGHESTETLVSRLDKYSRLFFPVTFFILMVVYWVTYLRILHSSIYTKEQNQIQSS